ncbi:MAG: hypothetical protein J6Q99_02935 [Oscillospiraceae bacterium]|nr:hypothetical protein [Oscillospiraceae bacterium]
MAKPKYIYLPEANCPTPQSPPAAVKGDYPCPCCDYITIPNGGDAPAYICPVCLWEIDPFTTAQDQPSDQNHGLSLVQARQNFAQYGAVVPHLKQYCRPPLPKEIPVGSGSK